MKLETFELERTQSLWENTVEFNLTEDGNSPVQSERTSGPRGTNRIPADQVGIWPDEWFD